MPETRAFEGCRDITAYLSDDGHTFMYIEHWESREQYDEYLSWRERTGVLAEV